MAAFFNHDLHSKLYRAFNATQLLQSQTPLARLLDNGTKASTTDQLSRAERIAQNSLLHHKLEKHLSPYDYRILKIHYQQTDIPTAMITIDMLMTRILTAAKINPERCNKKFAGLCILSAAWQLNLFANKRWGPANRYHEAVTATRRKRMINRALSPMREAAMIHADKVLFNG